jgi:hypothetical protein
MCLIVDTNQRDAFFGRPTNPAYAPAVAWITSGGGRLVYGGKLRTEFATRPGVARLLDAWVKSGRAVLYADDLVESEERRVLAIGIRSDDEHVLALARLSGARLICTEDADLIVDTRDKRILDKPRARIYQRAEHAELLNHSGSCGRKPTRTSTGRTPRT